MAELVRFPRVRPRAGPKPLRPRYQPRLGPWVPLILTFAVAAILKISLPASMPGHFALSATDPVEIAGAASVIDGDTIDIGRTRIRLFGIDAPELSQHCRDGEGRSYACGWVAKEALDDMIRGKTVRCDPQDIDIYGRAVAVCSVGDKDINAAMVDAGLAVAYRHYSHSYVRDEEAAQRDRRGLWAGFFELPEDYRHEGD